MSPGRIAGKVDREQRDPILIFPQQGHTDKDRRHGRHHVRHGAVQIHAGNNHVEHKEEQERVTRQIGEVQQQRQGDQIDGDLHEDVPLNVPLGSGPIPMAVPECQVT